MRIIVFPDGETFNTIEGCSLVEVPDVSIEHVEEGLERDAFVTIGVYDANGNLVPAGPNWRN